MGKRKQLEQEQQHEEEERKQVDELEQPEQDEEALKAEKKKWKKEKKEKQRAAEAEAASREERKENTTEAQEDERAEEASEKKLKKKRVKQEAEESADTADNGAETEEQNGYGDSAVSSEQTSADDDHFDLASLKRGNKSTASTSSAVSSTTSSDAPPVQSSTRIFIGNLPFKITDDLLHSTFSPCGAIDGVHWVTDKQSGKFYGSAFIDFQSTAALPAALQLNNTELLGRPIKVGLATGRQSAGQNRFNQKQKNGGHLALHPISDKPEGTTTVFLGNLSFDIEEETVRGLFKDCGEVKQVRWVEKDGVFKGCGFVEFEETEATDLAVKFNGREVLGRPMRVDYSGNNRAE